MLKSKINDFGTAKDFERSDIKKMWKWIRMKKTILEPTI
jgi:hypothetical protein